MGDLVEQLAKVVGQDNVLTGTQVHDDYTHDEALTTVPGCRWLWSGPAVGTRWRASCGWPTRTGSRSSPRKRNRSVGGIGAEA